MAVCACRSRKKFKITFFGGEPLLNKPLIRSVVTFADTLAKKGNKEISYSMTTNATLVDDEFTDYIKLHNITVMASLDGPQHIHDGQCKTKLNEGSFKSAITGINRLTQNSTIPIRCTLTHPVQNIKEIIDFFCNSGFYNYRIGYAVNPKGSPSPVDFIEDDFKSLIKQLYDLLPVVLETKKEKRTKIYSIFDKITHDIKNIRELTTGVKCGAGKNCLMVGVNGELFPCHRFGGRPNWIMRNIFSNYDISQYINFWTKHIESLDTTCQQCWAMPICHGACPWEKLNDDGSFEKEPLSCDYIKNLIQCAIYLEWKK